MPTRWTEGARARAYAPLRRRSAGHGGREGLFSCPARARPQTSRRVRPTPGVAARQFAKSLRRRRWRWRWRRRRRWPAYDYCARPNGGYSVPFRRRNEKRNRRDDGWRKFVPPVGTVRRGFRLETNEKPSFSGSDSGRSSRFLILYCQLV